jgi:thiamine transport system ATP-binding protein
MALRLAGVTVRYREFTAVADADLEVADGEVLALLGPSGSGKSTLLRAVAGLEPLAGGVVEWDGSDLAGVAVHRRGFGLVFQDGQLFPHRDVAGNVAFGLRMAHVPAVQREERVDELLTMVGLAGYQRRRVTELSGGEQQRVALARALAPRPRLLLLDEPLSALDRSLRDQLAVDLAEVLRAAGTTALLVTHDQDEAFTVADRVAVLRAGRITQVGTPDEVYRWPADEPTAEFLGVTTILDGVASNGVVRTDLGSVELTLPDGPVRLGLHPSAVRTGDGPVRGVVTTRAHRRDHVRLTVEIADRTVTAIAPTLGAPEPGDEVGLRLDPDGVAVLPQESLVTIRAVASE